MQNSEYFGVLATDLYDLLLASAEEDSTMLERAVHVRQVVEKGSAVVRAAVETLPHLAARDYLDLPDDTFGGAVRVLAEHLQVPLAGAPVVVSGSVAGWMYAMPAAR
jgi:hypothetical protein